MGFEPRIVRQNVVFHPYIKLFINPTVYSLIRRLLERYPSSPQLAKSEGMLRFHLEGRRPVKEQIWPECLKEKMDLLERKTPIVGFQ
jgi:hypothetical protein